MTTEKHFVPFEDDEELSASDQERAEANNEKVFREVVRLGAEDRDLTADLVARWHRGLLDGLSYVPDPCYLGAYRGSDHPWLRDYNVQVGDAPGVSADDVDAALGRYFAQLKDMIARDLRSIPLDRALTEDEVRTVAVTTAIAHGEWVRIHPFANGNGRTARLIANYVLARFRLNPVVRIRPRPATPFDIAAADSMKGSHLAAALWILSLIDPAIAAAGGPDEDDDP